MGIRAIHSPCSLNLILTEKEFELYSPCKSIMLYKCHPKSFPFIKKGAVFQQPRIDG